MTEPKPPQFSLPIYTPLRHNGRHGAVKKSKNCRGYSLLQLQGTHCARYKKHARQGQKNLCGG